MKRRMQITISEKIKSKMDDAKDFYGGYSGLIEKAVFEFLSRPVSPYKDDIQNIEKAKKENEWVNIESLAKKISKK